MESGLRSRRKLARTVGITTLLVGLAILIFINNSYHLLSKSSENLSFIDRAPLNQSTDASKPEPPSYSGILENADIYVVTLPRRKDRLQQMEFLRTYLGFSWTYVDAVESSESVVSRILDHIRTIRRSALHDARVNSFVKAVDLPLQWPDSIDALSSSGDILPLSDAETWSSAPAATIPSSGTPSELSERVACATQDFTLIPDSRSLRDYQILTRARIACWISHLKVIRRIAHETTSFGLILEDDVDMEKDIRPRLLRLWPALPNDWDIIFLGHCWSNESFYPPLDVHPSPSPGDSRLHPSNGPKCTHAYALSPIGARRLLLHLIHPSFAYSRAIDQALAWLVQSGRLRSFSIVPTIVVQRKIGDSDVTEGKGSAWKEKLRDGVFG